MDAANVSGPQVIRHAHGLSSHEVVIRTRNEELLSKNLNNNCKGSIKNFVLAGFHCITSSTEQIACIESILSTLRSIVHEYTTQHLIKPSISDRNLSSPQHKENKNHKGMENNTMYTQRDTLDSQNRLQLQLNQLCISLRCSIDEMDSVCRRMKTTLVEKRHLLTVYNKQEKKHPHNRPLSACRLRGDNRSELNNARHHNGITLPIDPYQFIQRHTKKDMSKLEINSNNRTYENQSIPLIHILRREKLNENLGGWNPSSNRNQMEYYDKEMSESVFFSIAQKVGLLNDIQIINEPLLTASDLLIHPSESLQRINIDSTNTNREFHSEYINATEILRFIHEYLNYYVQASTPYVNSSYDLQLDKDQIPQLTVSLTMAIQKELSLVSMNTQQNGTQIHIHNFFEYICKKPYKFHQLLQKTYVELPFTCVRNSSSITHTKTKVEPPSTIENSSTSSKQQLVDSDINDQAEAWEAAEQTLLLAKLLNSLAMANDNISNGGIKSQRSEFPAAYLKSANNLLAQRYKKNTPILSKTSK